MRWDMIKAKNTSETEFKSEYLFFYHRDHKKLLSLRSIRIKSLSSFITWPSRNNSSVQLSGLFKTRSVILKPAPALSCLFFRWQSTAKVWCTQWSCCWPQSHWLWVDVHRLCAGVWYESRVSSLFLFPWFSSYLLPVKAWQPQSQKEIWDYIDGSATGNEALSLPVPPLPQVLCVHLNCWRLDRRLGLCLLLLYVIFLLCSIGFEKL